MIRNAEGGALASPRYWFEPAVKKAKLRSFSWHCLRHTFASRLVMAGVDLRTVQELMGHKSIQMTVRYSHLTPKHTLAAVEMLAGAVTVVPTDTKTSTEQKEQISAETRSYPLSRFGVVSCRDFGPRSSAVRAADS